MVGQLMGDDVGGIEEMHFVGLGMHIHAISYDLVDVLYKTYFTFILSILFSSILSNIQ